MRGYRPTDHSACRRLWAELTSEHHRFYPGAEPVPAAAPSAGGEAGGPAGPAEATSGAGFEEYLTRLDLSGMWVAQLADQGVVGFIGLILQGRAGAVDPVVVTAGHRGQGIGRALIAYVAEQARRRNLRELTISPALRNLEAIQRLQRAGFDAVATVTLALDLTDHNGRWRDGIDLHGVRFRY
ncbi:GNAT family N-acetyltransferase [Planosporangium thailandense]|uniref:GNAT family N-acetyltransferase n=1 Tax=Planosporangium thailandense TaxID=765197 RepID=A0ABX0XRV1_9ACTN|nr:GNAT family N-acetyltransferase [Planosporangium thailandense]